MTATKSKYDITPKVYQFPDSHASVIVKVETDANGSERPSIYIQVIDAYRYQRELSIGLHHRPGNLDDLYWECHAYQHPGLRAITELSRDVAIRLIKRIIYLVENYPTLLFDPARRCEGFVHFHDRLLHWKQPASVRLLD